MANHEPNKQELQPSYSEADRYASDTTTPKIIYQLGDLAEALGDDAERRYNARQNGQPLGIVTGMKPLDDLLGGELCPGLHCVTGDPGAGKTAFALQVACDCGGVGVFVTCEMSPLVLLRRVISRTCNVPVSNLSDGTLTRSRIIEYALSAAAAAPGLIILDATTTKVTAQQIYGVAQKNGISKGARCMVVVDSLHSWQGVSTKATEYERLADCLDSLKSISIQLASPVMYVCERNRDAMKKGGGQSGGAGHRSIEYSAETVMELDHNQKASPSTYPEIRPIVCKLSKNRSGQKDGAAYLEFDAPYMSFTATGKATGEE